MIFYTHRVFDKVTENIAIICGLTKEEIVKYIDSELHKTLEGAAIIATN